MRACAAAIVVLLSLAGAGCGGSSTRPDPPGPFMDCPTEVQVDSPDGTDKPVTYSLPSAFGGKSPIAVSCSPESGSTFPVGTHNITCTATDAAGRETTCTFVASVKGPPRLTHTKFLAFGDSLTWGVTSTPVTLTLLELFRRTAIEPPPPTSYPSQLEGLLRARYRLQAPVVYNEGMGGEKVDGVPTRAPSGLVRLPSALASRADAEVLLIMEGTNDLLNGEAGATRAIEGLRQMVLMGQGANKRVFLATIPPQRAGGARNRDRVASIIPGFNDQIRALAASLGVPLVDVHAALRENMSLIGVDDLHPTPRGYVVIAQTFADAIGSQLEVRPPFVR